MFTRSGDVHRADRAVVRQSHYGAAVRSRLTALGVVSVLVVAACGSDDDSASDTTSAPVESSADTEPPDTEPPDTEPPATDPPATEAPTTEAPVETEPPLAGFEAIGPGPYDVGVQTVTINADSDRPLTLDIWFPLDDAGDAPLHQYTLLPGVFYESDTAVSASADELSADGPFPLVVYSHGSGGLRYVASNYTESIAGHGYIVAAPDHTGNTAVDGFACTVTPFEVTSFNRPNDVIDVIDAMTDPTRAATADFATAVDPEQIAVTGHSFGGFTTYAVASGFDNEIGSVDPDPRVDALIALAPAVGGERPQDEQDDDVDEQPEREDPCADTTDTEDPIAEDEESARGRVLLSDERLAAIDLPAMVIVGTDDTSTPVVPNVTRVWELTASDPHYRVELVAGQHQSFTDACAYLEVLPTVPPEVQAIIGPTIESQAAAGCGPGIMEIERAEELTNTFAITFLDSVFRDAEMIDADTTEIPDDVVFMVQ